MSDLVWADGEDAADFLGCVVFANGICNECALHDNALVVKAASQPRKD